MHTGGNTCGWRSIALAWVLPLAVWAQVPQLINYQAPAERSGVWL